MLTDDCPLRVDIPRDRDGSFDPILIPKHERRFTGFDERIIAVYARGTCVREIQAFLAKSYGTVVSPDFISSATDEVMAETIAWQSRPLEALYPVLFFDALRVKSQRQGQLPGAGSAAGRHPGHPGPVDRTDRGRRVLGDYASWKDRHTVAAALKPIYTAPTMEAALAAGRVRTGAVEATLLADRGRLAPAWDRVIPFFMFPPAIRRVIYTTNAIESINAQLRRAVKTRDHFPSDEAAAKLLSASLQKSWNGCGRPCTRPFPATAWRPELYRRWLSRGARRSAAP